MSFDTYFKFSSYAVVVCGALALFVSDGIGLIVALAFISALLLAFRFEDTKWQISERVGLVLIIFSLPIFYYDWQFLNSILSSDRAGAATLAHLILWLCIIKLWQKKSDRDWIFLYLISFFEILLAAGLSITPLFLAVLILSLFSSVCTISAFEIRKTKRAVSFIENKTVKNDDRTSFKIWRLPVTAFGVLGFIAFLALPLFFLMPRIGGASFGRESDGLSGMVGFSNTVRLGEVGTLQLNNQVVMRVRIEESENVARRTALRWRGVALDKFEDKTWSNTFDKRVNVVDNGYFRFGTTPNKNQTVQTFYLEPSNMTNLFGAPKILAIQGNFERILSDANGALISSKQYNRIIYRVISDTVEPDEGLLRRDKSAYPAQYASYLQYPERLDARIANLARQIIVNSRASNRYDAARAVERHLQTEFGYTLEQKSGKFEDPLSAFLFEVREGHCEYFATALALMLRTQGIATRVVNGFQAGNYNDAADAYIVTQAQAHSWVEVYFPETDSWVTFDPTPAAGRNLDNGTTTGLIGATIGKYLEAAEMFWLQYVVGYDNQEQRGLARTLKNNFVQTQEKIINSWLAFQNGVSEWYKEFRGEKGFSGRIGALSQGILFLSGLALAVFILVFGIKRLRRLDFWNIIAFWRRPAESEQAVLFYERMIRVLEKKGLRRQPQQTPLEFAVALAMPEAVKITEAYNRVRFGRFDLSQTESGEIENWLKHLEDAPPENTVIVS